MINPRTGKTPQEVKIEILCNKIEAAVGQKLEKHYSGYLWHITARPDQGIVEIKNLTIHGDYGFIVYMSELAQDPNLNGIMRAGGELLERCGLPTTLRPDNMEELVRRDIKGNVEVDTHGAT